LTWQWRAEATGFVSLNSLKKAIQVGRRELVSRAMVGGFQPG
jgi:hypothetical protein